ncbi:UNVERIFIED_CONTAM: hypothetical protein Sradi_4136900 [Sesamum radiatum]|uniref:Myb/SANT-like domain-containing protein n=1 Tax=Sesamum radiatum TaxID=300843 RepID=A0AAW2P1A5_SESRA
MFERGCANRMEWDNGFRTGYLGILEQLLNRTCLDSGLLADPHISSKIHVWKKTYGCINDMMGRSGFGCNATTQSIDVKDYVFDNFAKIDPFAKTLRYKSFSYYAQWCEVFGKNRAMGDHGLDPIVAPRNPGNPTPNERSENLPSESVQEIGNATDIDDKFDKKFEAFVNVTDARLGDIAKRFGVEAEESHAQKQVWVESIPDLTIEEKC